MSETWIPAGMEREWLIVCAASALGSKPLAVTLLGRRLVVFRVAAGVAALDDRCPHRHAPLSLGYSEPTGIRCPYHGWTFDERGHCRIVPGSQAVPEVRVPAYAARECHGWIWVALAEPRTPAPPDQLPDPGRFDRLQWTTAVEASLIDALENLLDATHTPFVHRGLVRRSGPRQPLQVQVTRQGAWVEACYRGQEANPGLISRLFERGRSESLGRFVYPSMAQLVYRDKHGENFMLHAHFSPIQATRQAVFVDILTRKGWLPRQLKHLLLTPLLRRVMHQDQTILAAKTANEAHFAPSAIVSTEQDLLRPHLAALLEGQHDLTFEGTYQLWL